MSNNPLKWQQVRCPAEGESITFTFLQHFPEESSVPAHEYEGFLIRFQGELKAYRNSCPHTGAPLNWLPEQFFSEDGSELVCSVHDARFQPGSGECISGPCPHGLFTMPVRGSDNNEIQVPAELSA